MAIKRPQSDCVEHTKDIINLKKDMESVLRHEKKFNDSIDNLELIIADLKTTIALFNEKFKDLPEKVRTLEDKSTSMIIVEKIAWLAVGAFIAVAIHQNYIATTNKQDYKVEKSR